MFGEADCSVRQPLMRSLRCRVKQAGLYNTPPQRRTRPGKGAACPGELYGGHVVVEEVGRLDSVDGDPFELVSYLEAQGLLFSVLDEVGPGVWRGEGRLGCVDAEEGVAAFLEVWRYEPGPVVFVRLGDRSPTVYRCSR